MLFLPVVILLLQDNTRNSIPNYWLY